MRLFVTGLAGYLGSDLASRARAAGWDVSGTVWRRPASGGVVVDVRDAEAVERAVRDAAPDVVVHTAYRQAGEGAHEVTVDGAEAVALAARAAGARLVHLSTDAVFSGRLGRPLTEEDPPDPVIAYGAAKATAELRVAAACPDAVLVRTSLLYGGVEPSKHESVAIEAADGDREMAFFVDELRSPIAVGDLSAALLELAGLDVAGPLHVGGADPLSRHEFARLVAAHHGRDPGALRAATTTALAEPRPTHCVLDSSRAHALLRTRLRGAREVLAPGG
jgi:dTDP-4-dehydrorhamnose reductase